MTKFLLIPLLLFGLWLPLPKEPDEFNAIESDFPIHWKSKVGAACFRGNVLLSGDMLIFGSNGSGFADAFMYDRLAGLYFLDRRTGKTVRHVGGDRIGDMDVNGVLEHEGRLFYGNDNEEFACTDGKGGTIWRLNTSGDVEHVPAVIDRKGRKAILFATETGEACAVDPSTGKRIWSYYIPGFKGWKPGENRMLFKVRAHFSNTLSFYTKPVVADLNDDGYEDAVYLADDDVIHAISGRDGGLLWKREQSDARLVPVMMNIGSSQKPLFMVNRKRWGKNPSSDSEKALVCFDGTGREVGKFPIDGTRSPGGLNFLKTENDETVYALQNALIVIQADGDTSMIDRTRDFIFRYPAGDSTDLSRNSPHSLFANGMFPYKGHARCILLLNQFDMAHGEKGFIEIVSLDSRKVVGIWSLPARSELAPKLADVDRDGKLDLLVSAYDGNLYCYDMEIPVSEFTELPNL